MVFERRGNLTKNSTCSITQEEKRINKKIPVYCSSLIINTQRLWNCPNAHWGLHQQNMVGPSNGILLGGRKELTVGKYANAEELKSIKKSHTKGSMESNLIYMLFLNNAGDRTPGFVHASQVLYHYATPHVIF